MARHVFISYNRTDRPYVDKLATAIRAAGVEVWYDYELVTGDRFAKVIRSMIDTCIAVVVVMTPEADDSHWVEVEVTHALQRGKVILPLLLRGERFLLLNNIETEDVQPDRLPGDRFFARLRRLAETTAASSVPEADLAQVPSSAERRPPVRHPDHSATVDTATLPAEDGSDDSVPVPKTSYSQGRSDASADDSVRVPSTTQGAGLSAPPDVPHQQAHQVAAPAEDTRPVGPPRSHVEDRNSVVRWLAPIVRESTARPAAIKIVGDAATDRSVAVAGSLGLPIAATTAVFLITRTLPAAGAGVGGRADSVYGVLLAAFALLAVATTVTVALGAIAARLFGPGMDRYYGATGVLWLLWGFTGLAGGRGWGWGWQEWVAFVACVGAVLASVVWAAGFAELRSRRRARLALAGGRRRWFGEPAAPPMLAEALRNPGVVGFATRDHHFALALVAGRSVMVVDDSGQVGSRRWKAAVKRWAEHLQYETTGIDVNFIALVDSPLTAATHIRVGSWSVSLASVRTAQDTLNKMCDQTVEELYVPVIARLLERTPRNA